jgi:hypothetical protein
MLAGEGCEHLPQLKELALSYDASVLQDFPSDIGRIAKKACEELVDQAWSIILYAEDQRREPGELHYILFLVQKRISLSFGSFLCSQKTVKFSRVTMPMRMLTLQVMTRKQKHVLEELPLLGRLRITLKRRCSRQRYL